jgi:hypothetical protein
VEPVETAPGVAKVGNAQDLQVFIAQLHSAERAERVLARLPEGPADLVANAGRTTWIPIEDDACYVDAVVTELGPDAEELWHAYTSRFMTRPIVRALIEGATRLFGLSPGTFVRIIPRIWASSFKHAGQVELDRSNPEQYVVTFSDLHPAICAQEGYFVMLHGLFRGIYTIAGSTPDFELDLDRHARRLEVQFRWADAKAPEPIPA